MFQLLCQTCISHLSLIAVQINYVIIHVHIIWSARLYRIAQALHEHTCGMAQVQNRHQVVV